MEKREEKVPLLPSSSIDDVETSLVKKTCIESKKLWRIVGPAIFSRITIYGMNIITQAFAGHLGDLELASISIALTFIVGFSFGLLLGMASALETLCGQAYGAKKYDMLGIYLQRSWMVLFASAILMLPLYVFATPILKLAGQPDDIAELTGTVSRWLIPLNFSLVLLCTLQRFLQCQLKNAIIAWISVAAFIPHVFLTWLFVYKLELGLLGAVVILNFSWWVTVLCSLAYATCGGCPLSWTGFSMEAFSGLWEYVKLSVASGVMLSLENWYYTILILLAGNLKNAEVAVDALSICNNINGWEMMIPLAFFAGTGVRVANELGAGNWKAAKFATKVSVMTSLLIGLLFWSLILAFHDKFALIFTSSDVILKVVDKLAILLAFTVLLNSVQPILSGVAVGSGWQSYVAYVNIGCYYVIGVPLGIVMGWVFNFGVMGIWAGMIGGTAIQTVILAILTIRCDWEKEAMKASLRMERLAHPT